MKIIYITFTVLLLTFAGCSRKTPIETPSNTNLKEQALIIGSFSRPDKKAYYRESSLKILDLNKKFIKSVFITGKEDITSLSDPFKHNDDFNYANSSGSIFSFLLLEGEYYITEIYTGSGPVGSSGNYVRKLSVKNGNIIYIGDFHFIPILKKAVLVDRKVSSGVSCNISNQFNRDYNTFNKHFKDAKLDKENVQMDVQNVHFKLGNHHNYSNPVLYVP